MALTTTGFYMEDLKLSLVVSHGQEPEVVKQTAATALVDGHNLLGQSLLSVAVHTHTHTHTHTHRKTEIETDRESVTKLPPRIQCLQYHQTL